jgi:tyrosyl-tRNA synthetase
MESKEANVWTAPLVIDKATGNKFGKTESGAIWLDPKKTTPTAFYQFWINASDEGVEDFLKIYTLLTKDEIDSLMTEHSKEPKNRLAQKRLASEVTKLVHGEELTNLAIAITAYLINEKNISEASEEELDAIRIEIPSKKVEVNASVVDVLVSCGLASSNREAREFIASNAIYVNGQLFNGDNLSDKDFNLGRTLIRKGKAFKDSALLETN